MRNPVGLMAVVGPHWDFIFFLFVLIRTGLHDWFQQMQMIMCDLSANWNNSYRELEQRILSMEQKLDELSRCFHQTSELLSQVLLRRSSESRWRSDVAHLKKHNRPAKVVGFFLGDKGSDEEPGNYLQCFHQDP